MKPATVASLRREPHSEKGNIMKLSNAKKVGLTLVGALALMLCAGASAKAQDIVRVSNPTTVTVSYDFSYDGGRTYTPTSIPPRSYQDFRPVGVPLQVRYFAGAA